MSKLNMKEWINENYPKERSGGYAIMTHPA